MTFICNAGFNVASVLPDGSVNYCFNKRVSLGNMFSGFQFKNNLTECKATFCDCPLYSFEPELYKKATNQEYKERRYDAFLHWHVTYSCNLRCHYCRLIYDDKEKDNEIKRTSASPIDVSKMMDSIRKTGNIFMISFMGGEAFRVPNMDEVCEALTKDKHTVSFNTNFTLVTRSFFERINLDYLGCLHISCHIRPMQKKGLTETFIKNIEMMRDEFGHNDFYVTVVSEPWVFENLDEHREYFGKHGIELKLIPMLDGGGVAGKVYPESYTEEQLREMDKDWLKGYFPQKYKKGEVAEISEYTYPVLNNEDRG